MDAALRRQRYVDDAITMASPARLVTMLYDRLVRDLCSAEAAIDSGDAAEVSRNLVHAQEIVLELRSSLKPELWEGGPALASLYAYLVSQLIAANVAKDAGKIRACRALVEPLRDAWHAAAGGAPVATAATSTAAVPAAL